MRVTRFLLPLFLVAMWPASMVGVTLTVGNEVATPNSSDVVSGPTRTDIDLVHPATHSGNVTTATVYWSSSGCANALKIKFFRRTGDTLTMIAERGPFTSGLDTLTVTLTPPVAVQQGDLIGVARITNCGNPGTIVGFPSEGYLQYASDVTGSVAIAAADARGGGVLALNGSGTVTEFMARVFPVVGSTAGSFGSHFKTEMQFFNPQTSGTVMFKLVFHPQGTAGSSADPTRLVSLDPREVFSTSDVIEAMGQSGLGSLDIVIPAGQSLPIILARVYNDAGAD
ncbi:MAG: hypothetical protein ACXVJT_13365, partial [Thermoanaerobaculia bacterium]